MKIVVLLFAGLREAAGINRIELDIAQGTTLLQISIILKTQYPMLSPYLDTISFALDKELVPADSVINKPGEVALIPPVSGGME